MAAWITTLRFWHVNIRLIRLIKNQKADFQLLDVGCGSGEQLIPLALRIPGGHFSGMDHNPTALKTGIEYMNARRIRNVEFFEGNIESFTPSHSYDIICAVSVIQYLNNLEAGIGLLHKAMKINGSLLLYIPVNYKRILPGYRYVLRNWFNKVDYNSKHSTNNLSENELRTAVENAGLTIRENYYVYGMAGKVSYELMSFGQLAFFKLPWILALLFALVYFPVIILPVWMLMAIDLVTKHRSGNGYILIASREK